MFEELTQQPYGKEIELIVECSRTRIDAKRHSSISMLVHSSLDWDYIFNVSVRNAVLPIISWNLLEHFSDLLPTDIKKTISVGYREHVQRNMYLSAKLLEIVKLFNAHSIPLIPFKGPSLAVQAYSNLSLRRYGDLDILV